MGQLSIFFDEPFGVFSGRFQSIEDSRLHFAETGFDLICSFGIAVSGDRGGRGLVLSGDAGGDILTLHCLDLGRSLAIATVIIPLASDNRSIGRIFSICQEGEVPRV